MSTRQIRRTPHLPPVDDYVPDPGLVVELDESQHFTGARLVSLRWYPLKLPLGYDRDRWIELCRQLDKHDNDRLSARESCSR